MLFLAGALILCTDAEDTVGIDVETYLNLRDSARCRCNTVKVEDTYLLVVLCHRALTLKYADLN